MHAAWNGSNAMCDYRASATALSRSRMLPLKMQPGMVHKLSKRYMKCDSASRAYSLKLWSRNFAGGLPLLQQREKQGIAFHELRQSAHVLPSV